MENGRKQVRLSRVPAMLDVHRSTVYLWVQDGLLPIAREIRRKGCKRGVKYVYIDDVNALGQ